MNRNEPEDLVNELIHRGKSLACDEDGFVTLTDKEGNSYVAQTNKEERDRYESTGKKLSQVKKEKKESEKKADTTEKKEEKQDFERGKKLSEEDINTFYEKQKTLADMKKTFSDNDYELSENDSVGMWYKDGSYKHFDAENDPKDFKKALKESGIKSITLESDWGMTYYGKDNEIIMRNGQTDEKKTMADLKKEGIYQYDTWFVDDVKENGLAQDSALEKYFDNLF